MAVFCFIIDLFCKFVIIQKIVIMNIAIEKQNIVQWVQNLSDEKIIEKILALKDNTQISPFEKKLIDNGLRDIEEGNIYSHEEVKENFKVRFSKK